MKRFLLLVFTLLNFSFGASTDSTDIFDVSLKCKVEDRGEFEELICKFEVKNISEQPAAFLKRNTPFSGFSNDYLIIKKSSGEIVEYSGMVFDLDPPTEEEYKWLNPGEVFSTVFSIDSGYIIETVGEYEISYKNNLFKQKVKNGKIKSYKHVVKSKKVQIKKLRKDKRALLRDFGGANDFTDITDEINMEIAYNKAIVMAENAYTSMSIVPYNNRVNAERYIRWFGEYDSYRYEKVTDNFRKIHNALKNQIIKFKYCPEGHPHSPNANASVYRDDPYVIYIYPAYWDEGKNTATRASIIIHEMSHFRIVANTNYGAFDEIYNDSNEEKNACELLAISCPQWAIENADSYEMFARISNDKMMEPKPSHGFSYIPSLSDENNKFICVFQTEVEYYDYYDHITPYPLIPEANDLNAPVTDINFYDAILYCNAKSEKRFLDTVYTYNYANSDFSDGHCIMLSELSSDLSKNGYRLPTRKEWENAYLGGLTKDYNSGYFWPKSTTIPNTMNFAFYSNEDPNAFANPVGQKISNNYGLYDMAGNVSEMVNLSEEDQFIRMNGSFASSIDKLTYNCTYYSGNNNTRNKYNGFRIARNCPDIYVDILIPASLGKPSLYVAPTEVTVGQYQEIMNGNSFHLHGDALLPKVNITYFDAILYCNKLSKMCGLDTVYVYNSSTLEYSDENCIIMGDIEFKKYKNGYRLPSKEEWIRAYRGGTTTRYFWEEDNWGYTDTKGFKYVQYWYPANDKVQEVGEKLPNNYGLYDMAGNVREWSWSESLEEGYLMNWSVFYRGGHPGILSGKTMLEAESFETKVRNYKDEYSGFRVVRNGKPDITPAINLLLD